MKAPTKCLIKFYSPTCHYCHALKPIYEILSDEEEIDFYAFNIVDYPDISKILNFDGVPTIMMLQSGGGLPRRRFIKEPVDPDRNTWYTGNDIRKFIQEV